MLGLSRNGTRDLAASAEAMAGICCSLSERVPPFCDSRPVRLGRGSTARTMSSLIALASLRVQAPLSRLSIATSSSGV